MQIYSMLLISSNFPVTVKSSLLQIEQTLCPTKGWELALLNKYLDDLVVETS